MRSMRERSVVGMALLAGLAGTAHGLVHPFPATIMEGAQETPPVTSDGSGTMDAVFNDASRAITWYVEYELDTNSTSLNLAHFHGNAAAGTPAGVKINLADGTFPKGRTGFFRGTSTVAVADVTPVINGLWYINLHSNVHSGGELRGQMVPAPFTHYFDSNPITPAQASNIFSTGNGTLDAAYDAATNTLTFGQRWSGLSSAIIGMVFQIAPPGSTGPIAFNFTSLGNFPTTTTGAFANSVVLNDSQEESLLAGNFYVNIRTVNHAGGEIRGQLIPTSVVPPVTTKDWLFIE